LPSALQAAGEGPFARLELFPKLLICLVKQHLNSNALLPASPKGGPSYPPDRMGQECGMSFPKKGKSFQKRGGDGNNLDDQAFAMKIASGLHSELKDHNSRAKSVAGWAGAHERTVKNWILGRYAPCGRHLVVLAQHSDAVLNAILSMADRQDLLIAQKVEDLRRKVFELAALIGPDG
jgi:hypothetical protein